MKRQNTQSIDTVLKQMFQDPQFSEKLGEARVVELWPEVAGASAKERTTQLFVKHRKLYVKVNSPALKSNLQMELSRMVARLNELAGADVLDSIVLL